MANDMLEIPRKGAVSLIEKRTCSRSRMPFTAADEACLSWCKRFHKNAYSKKKL